MKMNWMLMIILFEVSVINFNCIEFKLFVNFDLKVYDDLIKLFLDLLEYINV